MASAHSSGRRPSIFCAGSGQLGKGRFFCLSYIVLKVQLAAAPCAKTSLKPDLEQMQPSCFLLWHISTLSLAPAISRLLNISASELFVVFGRWLPFDVGAAPWAG